MLFLNMTTSKVACLNFIELSAGKKWKFKLLSQTHFTQMKLDWLFETIYLLIVEHIQNYFKH